MRLFVIMKALKCKSSVQYTRVVNLGILVVFRFSVRLCAALHTNAVLYPKPATTITTFGHDAWCTK